MATALRVSTTSGAPSTRMSTGPRTRTSSPRSEAAGSDVAPMLRNGTASPLDPVTFPERGTATIRVHMTTSRRPVAPADGTPVGFVAPGCAIMPGRGRLRQ